MPKEQFGILFVCLGNICRSSLAEGICRSQLKDLGLADRVICDSCGTGSWHVGESPHTESFRVAKQHGVSLKGQKARQVDASDLEQFDLIIAMDQQNRSDLYDFWGSEDKKIICLREYDTESDVIDVPDPYYGGNDGFDEVFDILDRSIKRLLIDVQERIGS